MKTFALLVVLALVAAVTGCSALCDTLPVLPGCGDDGGAVCTGDCDGNGTVSAAEVTLCRDISLGQGSGGSGSPPLSDCTACDEDGNGVIAVAELQRASFHHQTGCP